jgi:hypothetical protein
MKKFKRQQKRLKAKFAYFVLFLRYFVGKFQYLINMKMQIDSSFNNFVMGMEEEKLCLILDRPLFKIFDQQEIDAEFLEALQDFQDVKKEIIDFYITFEDPIRIFMDKSVIKEFNYFIKDFGFIFKKLKLFIDSSECREKEVLQFIKTFTIFYKETKIFF